MPSKILLVDKPAGFSSFQIVQLLKRRYKKVGHAGTLDPFASGLLIVLLDEATKKFSELQGYDKEYTGEMLLGVSTDTYDITGKQTKKPKKEKFNFTAEELNSYANKFIGEIEQMPPKFSALKKNGKRLYQLSRANLPVNPKPRKVLIKSFIVTGFSCPILVFKTLVGKGVYIRSLAQDFGNQIGIGAILVSLRRIRIGEYDVSKARKFGDILPT